MRHINLSVIVPVYNAVGYLRACVESLAALSGVGLEIILVDDGSTDGSGDLCDTLAEEYGCRVAHGPNGGVSVARNIGMKLAVGEWLWFVDADDWVASVAGTSVPWGTSADVTPALPLAGAVMATLDCVWHEAGHEARHVASVGEVPYNLWRCWFRRDVTERHMLHFVPGRRYAEDQEFILHYLLRTRAHDNATQATCVVPDLEYHYTIRPGAAMTRQGVRGRKVHDVAAVLWRFGWRALAVGQLHRPWVRHQCRRLLKTLWVTMWR